MKGMGREMKTYNTKYGILKGIGEYTLHPSGGVMECVLNEKSELNTTLGVLIPQYDLVDQRRKSNYSVSFYEEGSLRRISLNNPNDIMTPIGVISAELITFYKNGNIKRLFPLNGRLSAYWEEEDEYQMAKKLTFEFPFGNCSAKIIAFSFYENGSIKDLTFWTKEEVAIPTPCGNVLVRTGIAFFPDGSIKSVEPACSTNIHTQIGDITAFDYNANGISGDINSLNFTEEGEIKSLKASENKVSVQDEIGAIDNYSPEQITDVDGLEVCFQPLQIEFSSNSVWFNGGKRYDIETHIFLIKPYEKPAKSMCSDCSSCGQQCSNRSTDE